MDKFKLLTISNQAFLSNIQTNYVRSTHSERSEESSITRYKTGNIIASRVSSAWHSRKYVRNSFGLLARRLGFRQNNSVCCNWILRYAQNDDWARKLGCKKIAFTMAEILLSLTIIGVVAAITLPSLTGNINERTWDTQRRAFYARMSQAIALMGSLNGYGLSGDSNQTISNAAKVFVTDGLSKVLKINNICDYEHLQDCGLPKNITTIANNKIGFPKSFYIVLNAVAEHKSAISSMGIYDTKATAFETANGESVAVYYNPICQADANQFLSQDVNLNNDPGLGGNTIQYLCASFVFDMNGKKGPNTVGKDISTVSAFFPIDSQVANAQPNIHYQGIATYDGAIQACKNLGEDYRLPTIQEWMSFYVTGRLFDFESTATDRYWSITTSLNNPDRAWTMYSSYGIRRTFPKSLSNEVKVRCVKR